MIRQCLPASIIITQHFTLTQQASTNLQSIYITCCNQLSSTCFPAFHPSNFCTLGLHLGLDLQLAQAASLPYLGFLLSYIPFTQISLKPPSQICVSLIMECKVLSQCSLKFSKHLILSLQIFQRVALGLVSKHFTFYLLDKFLMCQKHY